MGGALHNTPKRRPPLYSRAVRKPFFLLAALVVGTILRLPTLGRQLLSDDEAIYAATADAMRRGARLYLDAVDHKPPLIYFIYQAGFALAGPFETLGAHLFVILAVLTTALAVFAIGRRGPDGDTGGVVAAGLFLVFSTTWHDYDALAANCELFLLAPQAWAAWLVLRASELGGTRRRVWVAVHLSIGVLVGLAALCKYQGLTFLGVSVAWLALDLVRGRVGLAQAIQAAIAQAIGVALPVAVFLLWARSHGSLQASLDWFAFNFLYVGAGLTGIEALRRGLMRLALIGGVALPVYLLGGVTAGATAWRWVRARKPAGAPAVAGPPIVDRLGLLWLLTSVIALCAGGRFFGHYFHLVLAPLALLASSRFLLWWQRSSAARVLLTVTTAGPALAFFLLATVGRQQAEALDEAEPPYDRVATRIAQDSTADERMFVWGNSPQLYILARRSMGTRFSFCNYMTGESPGTGTETGGRNADANVLPVSWTMLFEDLEQRKPALFVDAAAAGWDGYGKFPLGRYPQLAAYVTAHYRKIAEVERVAIYRRSP
jgi:hypothetical protein